MKTKLLFLSTLLSLVPVFASAYDIAVKNDDDVTIFYNYNEDGKELIVTYETLQQIDFNDYRSNYYMEKTIVIPDEVIYKNKTLKVTSIGSSTFRGCTGLTSVTIPNSVTNIGELAFYKCSALTSITIPNSVTSIGNNAFARCSGLSSINIPNSVTTIGVGTFDNCSKLTSITIPNSVTSIERSAFYSCSGLTSITIPNSVKSIGECAFKFCSGLTSITIPNSVTSIGEDAFSCCSSLKKVIVPDIAAWCNITFENDYSNPLFYAHLYYEENTEITDLVIPNSVTSIKHRAFQNYTGLTSVTIPNSVTSIEYSVFSGCSNLTSITISNSVTTIGEDAFSGCIGLTSITIPNSVTSIRHRAFQTCTGLTSITIPNSVKFIGESVFDGCTNLLSVVSEIDTPYEIYGKNNFYKIFPTDVFYNSTLYVPVGTIEKYKSTEGWKDFANIVEGDGGGITPTPTPVVEKCATPTISYKNGKLMFNCETEGAICLSSITDTDIASYSSNEIQLSVTYNINVYAVKNGYDNSEPATATLCWIDVEPESEGLVDEITNVKASPVMIQNNGGILTFHGVHDGTEVEVYSLSGVSEGSAISQSGQATVNTNLQPGSFAIVKIGTKSIKVLMK